MSSYEEFFVELFQKENYNFEREKTFKDLKTGSFRYDFYLGHIKGVETIVEIDGEYHFKPIRGRQNFQKQTGYDRRKNSYCLAKGIKLYRIPYWEIKNIKKVSDIFNSKFLVKSKWHNDNLIYQIKNKTTYN